MNWPDASKALVFSLTVNDGAANSTPSTVTITVNNVNQAPITFAGGTGNQFGNPFAKTGTTVTLSGANSTDPDGGPNPLSYAWTQTGGDAVAIIGANTVSPSFTAPAGPTTLTFQLVVNDGLNNSAPATVLVRITGAPSVTVVNDFTGDGKADPVLFQPHHRQLVHIGLRRDRLRPGWRHRRSGDYNGDHVADMAVFAPANSATRPGPASGSCGVSPP